MRAHHQVLLALAALLVLWGYVEARREVEAPNVTVLTGRNFFRKIARADRWFVQFYTPWDANCKAFSQHWVDLSNMRESLEIEFGVVDCSKELALCNLFKVKAYPTLHFLILEEDKQFRYADEDMSVAALREFLLEGHKTSDFRKIPNQDLLDRKAAQIQEKLSPGLTPWIEENRKMLLVTSAAVALSIVWIVYSYVSARRSRARAEAAAADSEDKEEEKKDDGKKKEEKKNSTKENDKKKESKKESETNKSDKNRNEGVRKRKKKTPKQ